MGEIRSRIGTLLAPLKAWARRLMRDVAALQLACRDPRVPWYAKAVAIVTVAYALSPIDLIPDFIPVLGYLDDAIIVPLGVALAIALVPKEVMAELRSKASEKLRQPGLARAGALIVIAHWLGIGVLIVALALRD
jgi:uncharacterized membrane protein YkvA (DUF1232 family)